MGNNLSDTNKWQEISLGADNLNNPYSLFDSKYSDHELNNVSWLQSSGQWNDGNVYVDAYDKLLKVYNGTETVEGLSVKLSTEEYTDYDFVINTAEETFRLPLRNGSEGMFGNVPVVGNGMTLGLTDGTNNAGLHAWGDNHVLLPSKAAYGTAVGTASTSSTPGTQLDYGVTTDPTKSGLVTDISRAIVPDGWKLYYYVGETVQNANLIDAGRIGEQLASKLDISSINRYPIETSDKSLMPSWYVVYSDGWCEQGSITTADERGDVYFLKSFVDNNYTLQITSNTTNTTIQGVNYYSKATNLFKIDRGSSSSQADWFAYGYIS